MTRSTRIIAGFVAGALGSLTGCMVGPNYSPPSPDLPGGYRELAGTTATPADSAIGEIAWWQRFNDDELASLVERAVAANNSLKVAEARVRQARSVREVAKSLLYPRIGVGASFLRFRGSESAIGLPDANLEGNLFQIGFDAEWTVDLFGGTRRLVESASADEQGADARRRGVVLMVVSETARAYSELRGVQRRKTACAPA